MIFTAYKGMSLVVLNKENYVKKAEELLNQLTYRTIPSDPTMLVNLLKNIMAVGRSVILYTEGFTPQGQDPQNSMGYLKYIRKACH